MKIEIHIEKLVVQAAAIGPGEPVALTAAIREGIAQQVADHGIDPGLRFSRAIRTIEHRHSSPSNGTGPKALGRHIADAIICGVGESVRGRIDV